MLITVAVTCLQLISLKTTFPSSPHPPQDKHKASCALITVVCHTSNYFQNTYSQKRLHRPDELLNRVPVTLAFTAQHSIHSTSIHTMQPDDYHKSLCLKPTDTRFHFTCIDYVISISILMLEQHVKIKRDIWEFSLTKPTRWKKIHNIIK